MNWLSRRRVVLGAAVALVAASAAYSLGAVADASPSKPYALTMSTSVVPGQAITATFANETAAQQLGSADLFVPAGVTVTGAAVSGAPGGSAVVSNACPSGGAQCVLLRNLSLPSHGTVTVTMAVTWPPSCNTTTVGWTAEVKQANNFNGTGNDLTLDSTHSSLSTGLLDSCHLAYGTQPHNVIKNQIITGADYAPGGPVTVDVVDANSVLVASSTAMVTVAIGSNPGGATLGSVTGLTQAAVGGIATFSDLTLNRAGDGYTLTAASPLITGATSSAFDVVDAATGCTGTCTLTTGSSGTGSVAVVANGTNSSTTGTLVESVFTGALACTGYLSGDVRLDPNTYEALTTSANFSKSAALEFPAPLNAPTIDRSDADGFAHNDRDRDWDDVLWNSEICFQAPYSFTTRPGTPPAALSNGLYTGLLPDCPSPVTAATGPCHNRAADTVSNVGANGTTNYDITLNAYIPPGEPGDPRMN